MSNILYPYQRIAVNYLLSLYDRDIKGGILSLDLGLGKTLTSLEFAKDLRKILIVCEKTNIQTWINEIDKHYEDESYIVLHRDFIKNPKETSISGYKYIITTFDFVSSLFNDGIRCYIVKEARIGGQQIREGVWTEDNITKNNEREDMAHVKKHMVVKNKTLESDNEDVIFTRKWDLIIVDEVSKIVNPNSKTSRAITSLYSDFYLILTGTPMINYSKDLYSLFRFLGLEVSPREFNINYFQLMHLINHIYMKTYNDVDVKLPNLKENIITIELTNEEKEIYDKMKNELRIRMGQFNRKEENYLSMMKVFTHMRMFLNYPYILTEGISDIKYIENDIEGNITEYPLLHDSKYLGSKLNIVIENLKSHKNKKILIFSQYVGVLKKLEKIIRKKLKRNVDILYGKTTSEDRISLVDEMNNEDLDVLLIQIKVGSSGLNIQGADIVYILEPSYNLSTEYQAIGRSYRIGRKGDVEVYRFIVKNSFEYYMLKIQSDKEKEKCEFLGGTNRSQKNATTEIIEYILNDGRY